MRQYIVRKGDSIHKIANLIYGTSSKSQDLIRSNGITNPNSIYEGQTLNLPDEKTQPPWQQPRSSYKKEYTVQYGDSLWSIAHMWLGNPQRWRELTSLNGLHVPYPIFVGQVLTLPSDAKSSALAAKHSEVAPKTSDPIAGRPATCIQAKAYLFVLADEVIPSGTLVRKVVFPKGLEGNPELVQQIIRPDLYGFKPIKPSSNASLGRHVLGMTESKYISASELLFGSPRFEGERFYINKAKLLNSGAIIHDAKEIADDVQRIINKTTDPRRIQKSAAIKYVSKVVDKEVAIEGMIPVGAIKSGKALALTRGLQFVQGVGIVVSTYDLSLAACESNRVGSVKPFAAESVRQVGGWGGATLGMRVGFSAGAAVGIELGPGAILTGAIGGLIGGAVGYFGSNWIAEYIYPRQDEI